MGKDVLSAFPIALICIREINVKGSFRYIHECYKGKTTSSINSDYEMLPTFWGVV